MRPLLPTAVCSPAKAFASRSSTSTIGIWQLYVAHIFIFAVFAAEVSYSVLALHNWSYASTFRFSAFANEPHTAIIQALLLRFQPAFLDILPLYIILLGVFPVILVAIARHPVFAVVPSATIYLLTQFLGWHLSAYPTGRVWLFNPLAWQFLFTIGAVLGYSNLAGADWVPRASWLVKSAVILAGAAAIINISWVIHWTARWLGARNPLRSAWNLCRRQDQSRSAPPREFSRFGCNDRLLCPLFAFAGIWTTFNEIAVPNQSRSAAYIRFTASLRVRRMPS